MAAEAAGGPHGVGGGSALCLGRDRGTGGVLRYQSAMSAIEGVGAPAMDQGGDKARAQGPGLRRALQESGLQRHHERGSVNTSLWRKFVGLCYQCRADHGRRACRPARCTRIPTCSRWALGLGPRKPRAVGGPPPRAPELPDDFPDQRDQRGAHEVVSPAGAVCLDVSRLRQGGGPIGEIEGMSGYVGAARGRKLGISDTTPRHDLRAAEAAPRRHAQHSRGQSTRWVASPSFFGGRRRDIGQGRHGRPRLPGGLMTARSLVGGGSMTPPDCASSSGVTVRSPFFSSSG